MSRTHFEGQVITECPDCGRSIRLNPLSDMLPYTAHVHCGGCENDFLADRRDGEVL